MLTVERLEDGEVSPYLATNVKVGDAIEIRGPIGGHFVWTVALRGPLFSDRRRAPALRR
jgi:ferredoxin-NADP reductase